MKNLLFRFAPSAALLMAGVFGLPHSANTAPPAELSRYIRDALEALRFAKHELQRANHDYCGHRAAALRDSEAASKQLEEAIRCAK